MTRILHVLDHSLPLQSGYTFRTRAILKAQQAAGLEVRGITGLRHFAPGPDPEHHHVTVLRRLPRGHGVSQPPDRNLADRPTPSSTTGAGSAAPAGRRGSRTCRGHRRPAWWTRSR